MKKGLFIFYLLLNFLFAFSQTEPVSLPYSNNFETEGERNYWYNINTGPGNPWVITTESDGLLYGPSSGDYYSRFQSTFQYGGTAWLISKGIQLQAGETIVLEFDYRSSLSSTYPQKLEVLLKEIPAPGTENSTRLWYNEAIQINFYQNVYQTFEVPTTGTYYMVFHAYSDPNFGYLSMDNVKMYVEQCPKPLNVNAVPGNTAAQISWTTSSQPDQGFEYVIQPAGTGVPTGSGTFTANSSVTAEGLSPETTYEVYVRSVCETGSVYSNWSSADVFTTYPYPIGMPVNLPYHESFEQDSKWLILKPEIGEQWERTDQDGFLYGPSDGSFYMRHYDYSNTSDSWIFSRGINLPAGEEISLEFDYRTSQDEFYPQKMRVVVSSDPFPSGNSVEVWNKDFIQSTVYDTAAVNFTVPDNGVYYLGFQSYSEPNYGYLMFDNVKVNREGISPCEYVLRIKDSDGDGWNYNTMSLLVNGDVVFDNITLPIGDRMDFTFPVSSGDAITTIWHGGSHSGWETSYEIYDSEGNLVGSASESNIDDPIYASCPDCAKPSNVVAHNGQTTVDITWDFLTEPENGYEYVVQSFGSGQPTNGIAVQDTYAHVDGLSPESNYELYVRANCSDGTYSSWAGPVYFYTLSEPGSPADLPYYYGFEDEDGWIYQSVSRNNEWVLTSVDPAEGQYHTGHEYNYYFDADTWLFSRGLNMQAGQEVLIKFRYKALGYEVPFSMSIANEAYGFAHQGKVVWSETISNSNYIQAIISYTPTTSGVYYLGFHSQATKGNSVFVDDVQVYTVGVPDAPVCEYTCPEDMTVVANPGDMGAVVNYDLNFECEGSSTGVISVLAQGLPSGAIFPIGSTIVTHNLIYNGEVIATCSFTVTVDENLSTGEVNSRALAFHPNPVKDKLTIEMKQIIENVSVYNLTGEMINTESWGTTAGKLDMSSLPAGVYIVNVKTKTSVNSFKVIKN